MRIPRDARIWSVGGALTCALALGAGYLVLVAPRMSAAAAQQSVAEDARASNDALRAKVTALQKQSARQASYVSQLRTVRAELPITDGLAALITQLQAQASAAKVSIGSITVGAVAPVVGAASAAPAAAADSASGSASGSASTSGSGSASGSASATASPTASTTGSGTASTTGSGTASGTTAAAAPVAAGPAGQLYQIGVTVISHGSLAHERAFLTALRKPGSRAALVSGTQWSAGQPAAAAAAPASGGTGTTGGTAAATPSLDASADLSTTMTVFAAPQTAAAAKQLIAQLTNPSR